MKENKETRDAITHLLIRIGYVRDKLAACNDDGEAIEPDEAFYMREGLVSAMSEIELKLIELGAVEKKSDIFLCERRY